MQIIDWLLTISSSSAVTVFVLWLARSLIVTRLTKSVQHEFDQKIEVVRSELRKSELAFQANIRASDAQLEALRSGALSGMTARQALVDKRRIEAVDQLWEGVRAIAPGKTAVMMVSVINYEAMAKTAFKDAKAAAVFGAMGGNFDIHRLVPTEAEKARPYVSALSWACFYAYRAIIGFCVTQFEMLRFQIENPQQLLKFDAVIDLVAVVLPGRGHYLKEHGPQGLVYIVDEIERELLKELRSALSGVADDAATLERGARIVKAAAAIHEGMANVQKAEADKAAAG
jgi:O6-methylguanine-DNA--protein-cysteine methyltransferase